MSLSWCPSAQNVAPSEHLRQTHHGRLSELDCRHFGVSFLGLALGWAFLDFLSYLWEFLHQHWRERSVGTEAAPEVSGCLL